VGEFEQKIAQLRNGMSVIVTLTNGKEIAGVIVNANADYIVLKEGERSRTIKTLMIGMLDISDDELSPGSLETQIAISSYKPSSSALLQPIIATTNYDKTQITPEIRAQLIQNNALFQGKIQGASINVLTPDFVIPLEEITGNWQKEVVSNWGRIKERYNYALKINEMGSQFGRIQLIVSGMQALVDMVPTSPSLKRHMGYFLYLSRNTQAALKSYQDAAVISQSAQDWFNVAALALQVGQEVLACYALEHAFRTCSIAEYSDAWYIFVGLLQKTGDYSLLRYICESDQRSLTHAEEKQLLVTCIYLLHACGNEDAVRSLMRDEPAKLLLRDALVWMNGPISATYQQITNELQSLKEQRQRSTDSRSLQLEGDVYTYKFSHGYGFLKGTDGRNYYFHRSAIVDDDLLTRLEKLDESMLRPHEYIKVAFESTQGSKGPVAINISSVRTTDKIFERANTFASEGEYPKAIGEIKRLLKLDPTYPGAQEAYERWRPYALEAVAPKGSRPFARAKRLQLIEHNIEGAIPLFYDAIAQNDNVEGAVKDLGSALMQVGRPEEAIQVLKKNRHKVNNQQAIDTMLAHAYQRMNQYQQAIDILRRSIANASTPGQKVHLRWQIGNCYLRLEDYSSAEQWFREVVVLSQDNKGALRNLAFCLIKQEHDDEAEQILKGILPDPQADELLQAISQARETGQTAQILAEDIIIDTSLNISSEMSGFVRFFLDRCVYEGVRSDRVQEKRFDRYDIQKLEELAMKLGARRPRERAEYYLSAAKILSELGDDDWSDISQMYKFLCRSFTSRGDAAVIENKPLDTIRECYCEAMSIYGGGQRQGREEKDLAYALVRYLLSMIGHAHIPITSDIPSVNEALETIFAQQPQREKVFDAIAYLVYRSRFAARHVLKSLYEKPVFREMSLHYLQHKGLSMADGASGQEEFVHEWNELLRKNAENMRTLSLELESIAKVELTTASVEQSLERIRAVEQLVFFDLDHQRVRELQRVLEMISDLSKQFAFEEQERICTQIDNRCRDLLLSIEGNPTTVSIEILYSVVKVIQEKIKERLEEIYESSVPKLKLRLPVESYFPDNNQRIEVQVVVENKMGCSPAESLELIVQVDEDFFTISDREIKLGSSLRGGESAQEILRVPIKVTEQALYSEAFSLPVYAQYRIRSGENQQTPIENFAIRLSKVEQFIEIANPYAPYAMGGVVGTKDMFYGRGELITRIAKVISATHVESKAVVIYGQKRSGKTSILYHLKEALSETPGLLIADVGNIGSFLDEQSSVAILYQILGSILLKLKLAVEIEERRGRPALNFVFPTSDEFYSARAPVGYFKEVLEGFHQRICYWEGWQDARVVVLMDEFSYIYGYIMNGKLSPEFMKNWKALLQENYFSVVLVGQDVMPKFKQAFPNEFGTIMDERVSYLNREDAVKLIDEPIRIGGKQGESRYREKAIERIVDLTAGNPYYIQIICNRLVEYMNSKRAILVTEADVDQVKNDLIRGVNPLGWEHFDNLISSGDTSQDAIPDEDAKKVLTLIAINTRLGGSCPRNNIITDSIVPIDTVLEDLEKREVIDCEQSHYYSIRVKLFKEWLIIHQ
jgi:tetratricopeptide (TPR) repeat protein